MRQLAAARGYGEPEPIVPEEEEPSPEDADALLANSEGADALLAQAEAEAEAVFGASPVTQPKVPLGNVPRIDEGIMIGGGPAPVSLPPEDPWEASQDKVVKVGAKITLADPEPKPEG